MPAISGISSVIHGSSFIYEDRSPEEIFTREDISEEQRMFAAVADEFMRKEVLTRAEQIYAKDWPVTRELLLKAGELDLLRIDIPEDYGGLGLDKVSSAFVGEQIAVMPSFGASLGAHTTIGTLPIVYFGTPQQREKYLPKLATGEWIAAYCLTEPGSGSDALAAKTKATLSEDGSGYILKGQKMWITNGGFADVFIIFAKVDGDKFTAFIVERGPGLVTGHEEKKLGLDGSSTTAVMLEDCFVPKENVLGEIGKGHVVAFNILNLGRLKLGSRNIGGAKVTLNHAIAYSKERHQFGRPISSFGLIKRKLAEMAIRCYVGDAIVWRTLGMIDTALENIDSSQPLQALKAIEQYAVECSIIKVWTSEALALVTDETVQVYGGYGYSKDYPAERAYRDARITRIYEGTNEINRIIIPTRLLKGPAKDHLPDLDEKLSDILDFTEIDVSTEGLTFAHRVMANIKETARLSLAVLRQHFNENLNEEQESVALVADIVAEAFAVESALLRAEKMIANNSTDANCEIVIDIVRAYANDAAERVALNARNLASVIPDSNRLYRALERLALRRPVETISIRRRIADHLIEAGRYGW
ncbi:MAG: acyl-CoA dehydrogenase family protein [Acidobacteria bacterium]|nr:acyl-CoA dehydrogenase family protein [Acidobacteriota bacterium]